MEITPELLLSAYAAGLFPMAEGRNSDEIHWIDPERRGVFELSKMHISRSLSKRIRADNYQIRTNHDFAGVVWACADREDTWINKTIFDLYQKLHERGFAHSLEVWQDARLIGGVYGVTLGQAFFGESMFSRQVDGSKIALAWLGHRLRAAGFTLFDAQFLTPHLRSMGAEEISREEYHRKLAKALLGEADFETAGYAPDCYSVAQRRTQTS